MREKKERDPGSLGLAITAWVVMAVAVAAIFIGNQRDLAKPAGPVSMVAPPSAGDPYLMQSRIALLLSETMRGLSPGGTLEASNAAELLEMVDQSSLTTIDALRHTIVEAQVGGNERALAALDTWNQAVDFSAMSEEDALAIEADEGTLRAIYEGRIDDVTDDQRAGLFDRHGYFGKLALAQEFEPDDPRRAKLVSGGGWLLVLFCVIGLLALAVLLGVITSIVLFARKLGKGTFRWRFAPPTPGGSVFLETAAVFVVSFFLLKFVLDHTLPATPGANIVQLLAQWVLVLVPFYPLLRGVSFGDLRERLGWTKGQGFFREVGAGLAGYLAGLPLVLLAVIATLILVLARSVMQFGESTEAPQPLPSNPIIDIVAGGGALTLFFFFTLATLWAPLVEETIFRGALFRHLRGSWNLLVSAVVSALVFGALHGYEFTMLLPVITLGFNFAIIRNWRGSLIGPMVAHALHNATVLGIVIAMFSIIVP